MVRTASTVGRGLVGVVGISIAAVVGWGLFVALPTSFAELLGVVLTLGLVAVGARIGGNVADRLFPNYNAAEVAIEGPITRNGGGLLPSMPGGVTADEIVEQIERADEDGNVEMLLLKLNTPGGEVVPSDDIRRAAKAFDGPTIAYATDLCASGGYWIASGCDELWARDVTLVGSIGVILSQVNASEFADRVGLSYEGFTAGTYKDAGNMLKEMTDDDREYYQGLTDEFYDTFVDRVVEGKNLDPETVHDTEARLYLGEDALELTLVDALGTREDIEATLEEDRGEPITIREYEPTRGFGERLRGTAAALARAFGAGVAGALIEGDHSHARFR